MGLGGLASKFPISAHAVAESEGHLLLDLGDGAAGVEALGACARAVEDGVAAVEAHAVVERLVTLGPLLVARIGQPAVRLQKDGGSKVFLRVPPVRRARCAAAGTEDALIESIQLPSVRLALPIFLALLFTFGVSAKALIGEPVRITYVWCGCFVLKIWLDGLVLLVKQRQVRNEVLNDICVRERIYLHVGACVRRDSA